MKFKSNLSVTIILVICSFVQSCSRYSPRLEAALSLAGENRVELEKVLAHYRGDRKKYKTALTYLEQSLNDQNSEVLETVGQSVALAQSGYYEGKSLLLDKDRRLQRQMKWLIFLIALMVVASGLGIYSRRKKMWRRQVEEISFINDEVNQRLNESLLCEAEHLRSIDSLKSANELAERNIRTLSEKLSDAAEKEQMLMVLRAKYVQANKRQYTHMNALCRRYLESSKTSRSGKDKIYA